jgi:hypothetical protein
MSMITVLVMNRMKDSLTTTMQTNVSSGSIERADVVKVGLFQEDPLRNNIHLAIQGGDHTDPNYRDGIVTINQMDNLGFNPIPREIGGGSSWWRRGTIELGCFFVREGLTEDKATEAAYNVLGRLEANLESIQVADLVDDFGEAAQRLWLGGNTFVQSGGPPRSYIFRGRVFWSCETERP